MTESEFIHLTGVALKVRQEIIKSIYAAQTGHAGSSLSLVEILCILYFKHMRIIPENPSWPERDYLLLSKGHGAPALYATLAVRGFCSTAQLGSLRKFGSALQGHPKEGTLPGIDFSTGSLGQGLSIALGAALGFKRRNCSNRVYCILGDGELQEGQVWEAMLAGNAFKTDNLVAIVDRNRLQNDGPTEDILPLEDLVAKAKAFGWNTQRFDGHSLSEISSALTEAEECHDRPSFLIADTKKGKGVSFMEGVVKWHHHPLSAEEFKLALTELKGSHD